MSHFLLFRGLLCLFYLYFFGATRKKMKIYFSHGKESGPRGSKIKRLAFIAKERGCDVDSVDYTDILDPDLRVERLLGILRQEKDSFLLVGSSMGAYVSLVASEYLHTKGVFLMAPALYIPSYKRQTYCLNHQNIELVHGWSDDVIPFENSIRFAQKANCTLHLIDGDHRLNSSIEVVANLFEKFLSQLGCEKAL